MNRLFWGMALFCVVAAGSWAQSTWRGQAEVWAAASAPKDGYVAASNEFPRNSLLTVENYKTKKTIQVRVVSSLPAGSSALVLLNAKAAAALEIRSGDTPLVGVRLDPSGVDRADNPDPDVNPLAQKPAIATLSPVVPAVAPPLATTPAPSVADAKTPAPTLAPAAPDTSVRTPSASSLEVARGATALDPDLMPLPALAEPPAVEAPSPLPVAEEPAEPAPVTPGKKVFLSTREPEPVSAEPPVVEEPAPAVSVAPLVVEAQPEPLATSEPAPSPEPATVPSVAIVPPEPAPVAPPVAPAVAPTAVASVAKLLPAAPANPSSWVSTPSRLEGPLMGQVPVLAGLEKGRSYVQVGAWADEATVLDVLTKVQSYVPLALYKAEGEKNPWRVVVAEVPKAQMGVLLMHFKSQGYRGATVVKG